jgi:alkylhydroperoxidase family enzyme
VKGTGNVRITGARFEDLTERETSILEGQRRKWGEPLANHLIYARVPEVFHGAQAMWRALGSAGKIESSLTALLNRRVAILNGCVF